MTAPRVFLSYSHADAQWRDQIEKQLSALQRQGVIEVWHDRRIEPGQDFAQQIDDHVNQDEIILLLVSSDFIHSSYCYEIEMQRAMERHAAGEAVVIPVILRACDWTSLPFGKLQAVPEDGKPIKQWADPDEAMLQVVKGVRKAASRWLKAPVEQPTPPAYAVSSSAAHGKTPGPRSSNLRLAKSFTERDKDRFKDETFEYVAKFNENSLAELTDRNPGYEGVFKRVDANRFFATIYRDGKDVARATYFTGGGILGEGINYRQGETTESSSTNETLTVEADDQAIFMKAMGMPMLGSERDRKLSQEGAAEYLWSLLIEPLQRDVR
ncbi:toll/interleukin-1 receptor domain-containing protein [Luteimonas aestuarii]|uniref:Toll/interleukin-1 receptor domain-containing protein n=1 Tax=Luteimonas aestuarii TaxID=453837 RepID=A0A4R5TY92_9GAMM|nr:toll/interleukin-1 receptor domain-containing protein [Luteimonas aestuarii]TDK26186.1 toll/interleukin-1 receptor domain-containing protein [Luteimonas aestuarii]